MPVRSSTPFMARWPRLSSYACLAGCLAACAPVPPAPQTTPAPAAATATIAIVPPLASTPAPKPAVQPQPDPANASDLAARRLLAYHERLRQMSSADMAAEVTRLGALVSAPDPASLDDVLAFVLALAEQHNPGDLARASSLLESITQDSSPAQQPWQRLANLLAAQVAEQKRLEEQLDRLTTQRRDTQRTIQQLTEKLEALKAIERSMTARPPATTPSASAPASGTEPAPAPKTP
jgi:hypothetical protein